MTWVEFAEYAQTVAMHPITKKVSDRLDEVFTSHDKNQDRQLLRSEFGELFKVEFKQDLTEDEIDMLFEEWDVDRDGTISFEEFRNLVSRFSRSSELWWRVLQAFRETANDPTLTETAHFTAADLMNLGFRKSEAEAMVWAGGWRRADTGGATGCDFGDILSELLLVIPKPYQHDRWKSWPKARMAQLPNVPPDMPDAGDVDDNESDRMSDTEALSDIEEEGEGEEQGEGVKKVKRTAKAVARMKGLKRNAGSLAGKNAELLKKRVAKLALQRDDDKTLDEEQMKSLTVMGRMAWEFSQGQSNMAMGVKAVVFLNIVISIMELICSGVPAMAEEKCEDGVCEPPAISKDQFLTVEIFVTVIFTLELLMRLVVHVEVNAAVLPKASKKPIGFLKSVMTGAFFLPFLKQPFNVVDLVAASPLYVKQLGASKKMVSFLKFARILRLLEYENACGPAGPVAVVLGLIWALFLVYKDKYGKVKEVDDLSDASLSGLLANITTAAAETRRRSL